MENKKVILHILFVSDNKTSGVRNIVPKHLEYQSKIANVALLNCNNNELEEAKGKYNVYRLEELKEKSINNLPEPFNKPDLVVFHAIYYPQYINLYKQCKKNDIPYIIVPHGSLTKEAQKQKWLKKIPANILIFNKFIDNATAIQYLIEGEQEKSRKCKKYIIAGNGIELSDNKKTYISDSNNETFQIIYIGRYDTYTKGLDLLIKTAIAIKDFCRENNIKFMLYGTDYRGRQKKIEKMISKNNIEDIVVMNGPIWGIEKNDKMCKSDLFIQLSRTEGQPIGLMEAIDVGLPCVVTKATNYGTIIEENNMGWVVNAEVKDICEKIIEAYNERKNLYKKSENEKQYAKKNFAWNEIAEKTVEKYKEIIK